jgi:hypothetical protein
LPLQSTVAGAVCSIMAHQSQAPNLSTYFAYWRQHHHDRPRATKSGTITCSRLTHHASRRRASVPLSSRPIRREKPTTSAARIAASLRCSRATGTAPGSLREIVEGEGLVRKESRRKWAGRFWRKPCRKCHSLQRVVTHGGGGSGESTGFFLRAQSW